ncbi:flagellar basal body rod protein FlgC [Vibrio rumoiensis]|uniref:flagellar basal body rod protein FlgC n=1 Tax=Vibrio rumoiensis TaxID=76258 RepID=UPI003AA9CAFD
MSFTGIYETAGSALTAQTIRLNTISSNLANADSVSGNPNDVYKPLKPVFSAFYRHHNLSQTEGAVPVRVADVIEVKTNMESKYEPENPLAGKGGMVYYSGINPVAEMADMMNATRSFEASAEVFSSVKGMQQSLLKVWEG